MKFYITIYCCLISFLVYSQRIGFNWINVIPNTSHILSCIDNEDNIIISGNFSGEIKICNTSIISQTNKSSIYIAKLDVHGNLIWLKTDTLTGVSGITKDNNNNIYLTGTNQKYISNNQYSHTVISYIYISKYSSNGDKQWIVKTNTQTSTNSSVNGVTSIASDSTNSLYITGSFSDEILFGSLQLNDYNLSAIFIAKYDSNGLPIWAKKVSGTNSNDALTYGQGNELVIDRYSNIYVTGSFRGSFNFGNTIYTTNGIGDIFLSKLDKNGVFLKTFTFGGAEHDEGDRLIIDKNNNLVLLAKFGDVITINGTQYHSIDNYNNAIILKFVNDSIVFAKLVGYSNGGDIDADICFDKNQNIIFTGCFGRWPTIYPTIYRIDSLGVIDWCYYISQSFNNDDISFPISIISDFIGDIFLTGVFENIAFIGDSIFGLADKKYYSYIEKIDSSKIYYNIYPPNVINSFISVYPSATHDYFNVVSFKQNITNSKLKIYNLSGQQIKIFTLMSNINEIDIADISAGIYFIEINNDVLNEKYKILKY